MFSSARPVFGAIASQLTAALDAYDADVERVLGQPLDADHYEKVSRDMDTMRLYAATLPDVSAAWVELLISHFEITHGLWRIGRDDLDPRQLRDLRQRQHEAVLRLRRQLAQLAAEAESAT